MADPGDMPAALAQDVKRQWATFTEQATEAVKPYTSEALQVWAASSFVAKTCLRYPAVLPDLITSGDLERAYAADGMMHRVAQAVLGADTEPDLMRALRIIRRREMVRIAWRDLTGRAPLWETLGDLSDLAETCIAQALAWGESTLFRQYGLPRNATGERQRLIVLGMGKLGGRELNFSSDIDLMFSYSEEGQTEGPKVIENTRFFTKLGQRLVKLLSEITADGFVFRVDLRLRPFGKAGPLAMSANAMEHYYQIHGRTWERYALVKARVVAGDQGAGEALLERLRPFVYRRYLDYGALAALREMKALVAAEVRRRGLEDDIKRGAGGIREIEFITQAFQLIRGGRERRLQQREVQKVLPILATRRYLPGFAVQHLIAAYEFLRRLENRLQMQADQQTHALPEDALERARLAFAMGFARWSDLKQVLDQHRHRVHAQFEQLTLAPQAEAGANGQEREDPLQSLWADSIEGPHAAEVLRQAGFAAPERVIQLLAGLRNGRLYGALDEMGRTRLDRFMPLMLAGIGRMPGPERALERLLPLIEAVARRSVYLALLTENPLALSQLVKLSHASPWIAEHLARYPILLDELLDPHSLYAPPDRQGLARQLQDILHDVEVADTEGQMERLRQFKQVQVLRVAASDLMDTLPVMKVSDQLTWTAEVILEQVLALAWRQLAGRYGSPCIKTNDGARTAAFIIIGYGKLGGLELGYGSDLDLVFLHDSSGASAMTEGPKPIENAVFFARLVQRMVHLLTTLTPAGKLYEIDMRLRPSGAAGLLVTSLEAFAHYQQHEAWTWEHQALVRTRPVARWPMAESAALAEAFECVRREVLTQPRAPQDVRQAVREMRARMWQSLSLGAAGRFDLKQDPGGIADIEFMVQYLVLVHAHAHPRLTEYPDNIRILDGLTQAGIMSAEDARLLQEAYRTFRDGRHGLNLQGEPGVAPEAQFAVLRVAVRRLWRTIMEEV